MKKFDLKSAIIGFVIGTASIATVFAAGGIQSAVFSSSKVYFYGQEIPLANSLVAVVKDGETNTQMYMPMRELLEYMNFNVEWNPKDNSINLTMNGNNSSNTYNGGYNDSPSSLTTEEADSRAIDIIQRTGNWGYIEPYLEHMSDKEIQKAVDIYNSKHPNKSEHKHADHYIGK